MRTTKQASTIMSLRHMATKVKPTVATNADQLQQDGVLVKLGPSLLADYMPTALVEPQAWQHFNWAQPPLLRAIQMLIVLSIWM